ncbi:flavodoxin family protein [Clostridium folliculivorans]|uniref:NADPH-dependent FMN reductase-like domain-containing protein n=1 Tax=Clostridium folliculivorans TaxID=2886038 RepID=A0A9W6DC62_9CLOT|nr:flavodoxin family protein [Clostridium folliculivorans]GKU26671.1 hypothetical protein CFOLD11_34980 [Clostridium folliculivorans]GKU28897.1 hypothetical protein CFB3_10030 [Clostridium folliculivorans]
MKKIFAYIGSQNGSNSYTRKLVKLVLDQVVLLSAGEIQYNLLSSDEVKIDFCYGCGCCFSRGFCPHDSTDAMGLIKDEMLQSDLIILASPVYGHNVTGNMKVFLDRISYWMHIFRLAGKLGVTISTSDSNGNEFVNGYLNKFMQFCGLHVICNFKALKLNNPITLEDTFENLDITSLSELIYDHLIHDKPVAATNTQESLFQHLKNFILELEANNIQNAEYSYWKENRYLESDNYNDLLNKIYSLKS